ncbi:hypothetical protein D3C85_1121950 [compost metagenome]
MGQGFVDEQVPRRAPDHLQHSGIGQPLFVQPLNQALAGTLRGHADAAMMQLILFTPHQSKPSSQGCRLLRPS